MSSEVVSPCYTWKKTCRLSTCVPFYVLLPVAVIVVSPSTAGHVSPLTNYYFSKKCTDFLNFFTDWLTMIKVDGGIQCADDTENIKRVVMGYA